MGATIDYAIVITNRYIDLRKTITDKREAVVKTLDQSFATIITSGSIMTSAKVYATICIFNRLLIDSISVLRARNKSKKEEKAFKQSS